MRPTILGAAAVLLVASLAPVGSASAELTCNGKPATGTTGQVAAMGTAQGDVVVLAPETARYYGDAGNDTICVADSPGVSHRIYAGPGDDWVMGGVGFDTIYGGSGADLLTGGDGLDLLYDDYEDGWWDVSIPVITDGADVLVGGQRNDVIYLNAGTPGETSGQDYADAGLASRDTISYRFSLGPIALDARDRTVIGPAGVDTFAATPGYGGSRFNDTLRGSAMPERITTFGGRDEVFGRGGDDLLMTWNGVVDGGAGADRLLMSSYTTMPLSMYGGPGPDVFRMTYVQNDARLFVYGGRGDDELALKEASPVRLDVAKYRATWNQAVLTFRHLNIYRGGRFRDHFYGSPEHEVFLGQGGGDVLVGRGGPDDLIGGLDVDTANGGAGRDTCRAERRVACELS